MDLLFGAEIVEDAAALAARLVRRESAARRIQKLYRLKKGLGRVEESLAGRVTGHSLRRVEQGLGLARRVTADHPLQRVEQGLGLARRVTADHPLRRVEQGLLRFGEHPLRRVEQDLVRSRYSYHPVLDPILRGPTDPGRVHRLSVFPEHSFFDVHGGVYSERVRSAEAAPDFLKVVSELRQISPKLSDTSFEVRAFHVKGVGRPLGVTSHFEDTVTFNLVGDFGPHVTVRDILYHEAAHVIDYKSGRIIEDHGHDFAFQQIHNAVYAEARRQGILSYDDIVTAMDRTNRLDYSALGPQCDEALKLWLTLGL